MKPLPCEFMVAVLPFFVCVCLLLYIIFYHSLAKEMLNTSILNCHLKTMSSRFAVSSLINPLSRCLPWCQLSGKISGNP